MQASLSLSQLRVVSSLHTLVSSLPARALWRGGEGGREGERGREGGREGEGGKGKREGGKGKKEGGREGGKGKREGGEGEGRKDQLTATWHKECQHRVSDFHFKSYELIHTISSLSLHLSLTQHTSHKPL